MSLETAINDDEKWFSQYNDVEWVDDVAQYQCTRCHKVLVQHYISNCQHKFCSNCKRILDDGSHQWRCPDCKEFIKDLGRQDLKFKDRVGRLRLHCPHRKYGCEHICPFKDLKEHLQECKHTKESALPVLYEEQITTEMLERMFTLQMLELKKEMKREMRELEEKCLNKDVDAEQKGVNESAWELNIVVNEMKREMARIVEKQKDGKWKLRVKLSQVNNRIDGVKSDLHVDTTRLRNEIKELQEEAMRNNYSAVEGISLAVEENKAKLIKLEGKTETWMEIMDFKDRKNNDLKHEIKNEFKDELKTHNINVENKMELFGQTMNQIEIAQEKKWMENNERVNGVIHTSNQLVKSLIKVNIEAEEMREEINNNKTEVEKQKRDIIEVNKKIQIINEENTKMTQQAEFLKQEMEMLTTKFEGTANQLILPLNSSTKNGIILEQKVLHLESLFLLKNPQMTMFSLAEDESNFVPNFSIRVTGLKNRLQHLPFEEISEAFQCAGYPVNARAKVRVSSTNCLDLSLILTMGRHNGHPTEMRLIPNVYYVLKYQTEMSHRQRMYAVRSYDFPTKFDYSLTFNKQAYLTPHTPNPSYVGDAFDVNIYVEPPAIAYHVHSYDGTLSWAIENYYKRKLMANGSSVQSNRHNNTWIEYLGLFHESPYFYTGPRGYRVQVRMVFNGGLRAEIRFLPGEFDSDLPVTFPHQTTVTLFNRKDPRKNITKSVKHDIQINKYCLLEMANAVDVINVVENDHLFYKVTIEASQN